MMLGLDAILGTWASDRDEVAIEIGLRQQYPWHFTKLWSGDMKPPRAQKEEH